MPVRPVDHGIVSASGAGGGNVTGGTRDESHGDGYIYEVFYASGTMVVTGAPTIDLLICGGGGGAAKGYNSTVNSNQGGGGAAGWTGVASLGVAAGSYSVVIGAGGVGLNMIQCAKLYSAHPIIAVDRSQNRLELAQVTGATHLINNHDKSNLNPIWLV